MSSLHYARVTSLASNEHSADVRNSRRNELKIRRYAL